MDQLQYQWISGTVPKNVLSDNQKKFHIFPEVLSEQDGFCICWEKGCLFFRPSVLFRFILKRLISFFMYMKESFPSPVKIIRIDFPTGVPSYFHPPVMSPSRLKKGAAAIFRCIFPDFRCRTTSRCFPKHSGFRQKVVTCSRFFTPWSICTNFRQILRKILCFYVKLPCGLPIF